MLETGQRNGDSPNQATPDTNHYLYRYTETQIDSPFVGCQFAFFCRYFFRRYGESEGS